MSWPVAIAFANGRVGEVVGTVDYPMLVCGGEIVLVSVSRDEWGPFEARERLTYGQETCIDSGIVIFTSAEGSFRLIVGRRSPSGPATALATLDPAVNAAPVAGAAAGVEKSIVNCPIDKRRIP